MNDDASGTVFLLQQQARNVARREKIRVKLREIQAVFSEEEAGWLWCRVVVVVARGIWWPDIMFGQFYGHFSDINCSRFYPGVPITLFVKMASLFMNDFYHDLDESVQSCRL